MTQRTETPADRLRRGLERQRRTWTGVRVRDLLDLVDAPGGSDVRRRTRCSSRGPTGTRCCRGTSPTTTAPCWPSRSTASRSTVDHGYPARLIAPNRPGRAPDQVGRPAGGAGMRHADRARRARRRSSGCTAPGCCSAAGPRPAGNAATWLAAGVVLHDGVLALVVLVLGAVAVRLLPGAGPGAGRRRLRRARVGDAARRARARDGSAPGRTTRRCSTATTRSGWLVLAGLVAGRRRGGLARTLASEEVTVARVLVVDDDPTVREVVVSYLRAARPRGRRGRGRRDRAARGMRDAAARPGRARPDAARHRRARGLPPAARAAATSRSSC